MSLRYTIIIEKGRKSGFVAFCPSLKGCVAQGRTRREARKRLLAAMRDYIDCLIEDGLPVPREVGKQIAQVAVAVS